MQKVEEYAIIQDSDKKREVVYMEKSLKGLNIEEIIQEIGLYMPILIQEHVLKMIRQQRNFMK